MKNAILAFLLIQLVIVVNAQYQTEAEYKDSEYYMNPVFAGDYPDPSILRDGDDFYMVHSSFEYYPGLTIWRSKDMINWTPVINTLNKYVGSVWAPDLVKYDGKYYIYFPASGTNYVITADSIDGEWSDPVELDIAPIDPGHVVDEEGNRYLFFSSGGFVPLTKDGLSLAGEFQPSYSGWPIPRDWTVEGFRMEGPKLVKRGEYYYLTVAEGGTAGPATGHMVISARSKSLTGPWENSPYNPITRTTEKSERWCSKGHGTILEDGNGGWWMVFHAYENGFYNMGRQTLMIPVEWTEDGWYKIPDGITDETSIKRPNLTPDETDFVLSDSFDGDELKLQWKFFGEYDPDRFRVADNSVTIKAKGDVIANCSPLLCNASHHSYIAEVEMSIEGDAVGGLALFYSERASSGILADDKNILINALGWQFVTEENVINRHVFLRLRNINSTVDTYYSLDGENWIKTENSFETSGYHHNVLGGFMGLRIGLCSVGEGAVKFSNFKYEPIQ